MPTGRELLAQTTVVLSKAVAVLDFALQHLSVYISSGTEIYALVLIFTHAITQPQVQGDERCDLDFFYPGKPLSNYTVGTTEYTRAPPGCMPGSFIIVALVLVQAVWIKLMVSLAVLYMKSVRMTKFFPILRVLQAFAKGYVVAMVGTLALSATTQGFFDHDAMVHIRTASYWMLGVSWISFVIAGEYLCLFAYQKFVNTSRIAVKLFIIVNVIPILFFTLLYTLLRLFFTIYLLAVLTYIIFVMCSIAKNLDGKDPMSCDEGEISAVCAGHCLCLAVCRPFSKPMMTKVSRVAFGIFFFGILALFVVALIPVLFFWAHGLSGADGVDMLLVLVETTTGKTVHNALLVVAFVASVLEAVRSILVVLLRLAIRRLFGNLVNVVRETFGLFFLLVLVILIERELENLPQTASPASGNRARVAPAGGSGARISSASGVTVSAAHTSGASFAETSGSRANGDPEAATSELEQLRNNLADLRQKLEARMKALEAEAQLLNKVMS